MKSKVAVIIGTRPDCIKQWSPYVALKKQPEIETLLIHSGQHTELGVQAQETFNLIPDYTCRVLDEDKYRLGNLVSRLISQFTDAFYAYPPDLVLVHGDTSTAFSAAVAAFLQNIPVGHVEAGLRTSRFEYPFPEEGYRRAISRLTTLHFAPTWKSAQNLREEGINFNVYVTGNTVVDALNHIIKYPFSIAARTYAKWTGDYTTVLVTCHRRESYGEPIVNLCKSLKAIADKHVYLKIIWPVHLNPQVRDTVIKHLEHDRILLASPLDYNSFIKLMHSSDLIITDSGGVMEEAAVMGRPTLVLRTETERPECLDLDCIELVGYDFAELERRAGEWIKNPPKTTRSNVFGDGTAGEEIAEAVSKYLCQIRN